MTLLTFDESDIDLRLATNAFCNTSFLPEKRGRQIVREYVAEMQALVEEFGRYVTDDNRDAIAADLEEYLQGYIRRLNAYLTAHSQVASPMITGPARFPVARNQKRSDTADRRSQELLEYRDRFKVRLRKKYDPRLIARAPISSGDDDAIAKLRAKIEKGEQLQVLMKAANAVIRQRLSDEQKVAGLVELGIKETRAWKLLKRDFAGQIGFASYELTNNAANIRRMKERVETLQRECSRVHAEDREINGVRVVENREMNRLQLFFPGKPPVEVRNLLKRNGFKWAPSQGAWQRQLTDNAARAAAEIVLKEAK